jgi:glycosyltransferase involved in cell wall biosynthesis
MKSLYFGVHPIWPVNSGARVRDYQLARHLAKSAEVTFIEMNDAAGNLDVAPPENCGLHRIVTLQKDGRYSPSKIVKGLAGPTPVTVLNCWSPQSASRLAELLRSHRFDTVQIEGVHLTEYLPIIQDARGAAAIIVDWHNIESEIMWRYAKTTGSWVKKITAIRTATLIERAEDRLLRADVLHTVTSERERQKLMARCRTAQIEVIPNGVDAAHYAEKGIKQNGRSAAHPVGKPTILFVGSMDYHANIDAVTWFATYVWPEIAKKLPDLHFTIVGRGPAPEVRALQSDRIHVTGTVEDVRPYYTGAVAAVVPIRTASGTRLKILEAMAAGVPVVSTRLGAEGIEVEDGIHLFLADSAQEIAQAVQRLALSDETRSRLARAAQELVIRVYDWSVIGEKLSALHLDLAVSRPVRALRKVS